jgi:DNA-binding XRE family transcriptional regulator
MSEIKSVIKVSLCFSAKEFNLNIVSELIDIIPTSTRVPSSFRVKEYACTEWEYQIVEVDCPALSIPLEKLIEKFNPKIDTIKYLCKTFGLETDVVFIVHMEDIYTPEFYFTKEMIEFIHNIGANFSFDIYAYGKKIDKSVYPKNKD